MFQRRFISDDANHAVVYLNPVNDRLDIGLAEGDVAGGDVFPHGAAEAFDCLGIESRRRGGLRLDALKRRFGAVAIELQAGEAVFQNVVEIGDAVLDHFVKPLQLFFRLGDFRLQRGNAAVDFERLLSSPRRGRGEDRCQPLRLEQALGQMLGHQIVELLHRNRAALAGGLALTGAGRARIIFMDRAGL
ncbi:hypothetical protein [Rhodoblastus sp.]|uniref:hypothetical protein n=1 Tax=Rhodoblastus sp. TaxID=1962975 RepID=UPI003F9746F5